MQIIDTSHHYPIHPQIRVDVGSLGLPATTLIDTGADTNTISYDLWEALGKSHLRPTSLQVMGFAR